VGCRARAAEASARCACGPGTPADLAWAETVDRDQVFNLAAELGPWFQAARLPRTDAFFGELTREVRTFQRAAKVSHPRERPWVVDARVRPCAPLPASGSYPSRTALQAGVWAELLAEAFPAAAGALRARARPGRWPACTFFPAWRPARPLCPPSSRPAAKRRTSGANGPPSGRNWPLPPPRRAPDPRASCSWFPSDLRRAFLLSPLRLFA